MSPEIHGIRILGVLLKFPFKSVINSSKKSKIEGSWKAFKFLLKIPKKNNLEGP